jgi:hypothetical protein
VGVFSKVFNLMGHLFKTFIQKINKIQQVFRQSPGITLLKNFVALFNLRIIGAIKPRSFPGLT